MPKKPRCSTCSTGWCKNHVLELNPLSSSLYYKRNFKIRLCPRLNKYRIEFIKTKQRILEDNSSFKSGQEILHAKFLSIRRESNKNNIIQKYYSDNDERVLKNHKLKVQQDANSNQTIWVPRHARKRNYCFVCKDDYNDYLEHMGDEFHKKSLKNNLYTSFILELQEKFAQQHKTVTQQKKIYELKRQASTEDSSSMSISDHNQRSFEFIRKIRKPNQEALFDVIPQIIEQN